jgi:hypothetical protein
MITELGLCESLNRSLPAFVGGAIAATSTHPASSLATIQTPTLHGRTWA